MDINLWQARNRTAPSAALHSMGYFCEKLNIEDFDVYGDFQLDSSNSWLRKFESEVAAELGMCDALFVPSGVMSQEMAMCIHTKSANLKDYADTIEKRDLKASFVCHHTSHALLHEQEGYKHLLGMTPMCTKPSVGKVQAPLNHGDIMGLIHEIDENPKLSVEHTVVVIECPHREIGGKITPFEELKKISKFCRERKIPLHMDGARLWEAQAGYHDEVPGDTIKELCKLFDTVYVSFYKGLGASFGGAMLLSNNAEFCCEARSWLRKFGGNIFSVLPYAVSCWDGFRENRYKSLFVERLDKLKSIIAMLNIELECFTIPLPSGQECIIRFDPEIPVVPLLHVYIHAPMELCQRAQMNSHAKLLSRTGRGVNVFARLKPVPNGEDKECYFEFNMGPQNLQLSSELWLEGYKGFAQELMALLNSLS